MLRINDNSSKPKAECELESPQILGKIANKTFDQLQSQNIFVFPQRINETEDLSKDQMILQSVNDTYCTGNVMGFLGYQKERLIIQSRFANNENDFFFQYLLSKVLDCPNVFNLEIDTDVNKRILDLLTFLFPRCLQSAMRKGLFKTYQRVSYNDSNPKGTIDVARHIKKNIPFVGKIAYSQREQLYDNYLIELIRHTIEFIRLKPYGKTVLQQAKDEVDKIVEATPKYRAHDRQKILTENRKHIIRHAYFYEYRELQQLCIWILQDQKQGIGADKHQVYGILFDGAWLWEEYVNILVKNSFYHPMNKAHTGEHSLFQNRNGRIYPDFIGKDKDKRIIADAKYKPIKNIKGDDYFQVLAYMMRFDAKRGFFFYPEANKNEILKLKLKCGTFFDKTDKNSRSEEISVVKLGLEIPQSASSYEEFRSKMEIAEKAFKKAFLTA